MRVLVAGATGAIGIPLTQALRARGHDVVGLTRSEAAVRRFADVWSAAVVADVLDRDALLSAARGLRVDVVVHEVTAIDGFPARYPDLDQTNRLRTEGTRNLLEVAGEVGATRLVTQSFFGGYGYRDHRRDLDGRLITEDQPFAPTQDHRGLERIVSALREAERLTLTTSGVEGIVLRYGALYGGATLDLMVRLLRRRQLPCPRGGGGMLSFLSLDDAGTATAAALEQGRAGQAYNVCDDQPVQWGTFLDEAARQFDAPRPLSVPSGLLGLVAPYARAFLTSSIPLSNAKLTRDTSWTPAAPTVHVGLQAAAASRYVGTRR